ncbi:hypothetical protein [Muribaculum intestinale]|jgi:hypothetical protein|uniref:hypothetical protein n=1 Tax=Muribaculum intestinale TaxID=1796646 RepID=UPI0025B718F9|nr:hypothetical protein [Muribaculum intestinale]
MDDIEYIPIDEKLKEFSMHLHSHQRTIFSAGFGEGKSFFINKFKAQYQDQFLFLTLYPVNYQVQENQDIFQLIKRDLLFQLFLSGVLNQRSAPSKKLALTFFLSNPKNYISWILDSLEKIDYPNPIVNTILPGVISFFKKGKNQFDKYCQENNVEDIAVEDFFKKTEDFRIYENDVITQIITESIQSWKKKNPDKKVILFIEDMDRIDPGHLFRIMNVLSAHMDYSYKFGIQPDYDTLANNKFGLDNVVLILDYSNLISIFKHFYGEDTNFEGYLSKFSNKGIFQYSLEEEKKKYILKKIAEKCCFKPEDFIEGFSNDLLSYRSLRSLVSILDDIDSQYVHPKPLVVCNKKRFFPTQLLNLAVILKRLGKADSEIVEIILTACKKNNLFENYLLPYVYLDNEESDRTRFFLGETENHKYILYDFYNSNDNGFAYKKSYVIGTEPNVFSTKEKIAKKIVSMVAQ